VTPHLRPARPDDAEAAVPLVHASGPELLDYAFGTGSRSALDFLAFAFADGAGFFGWRNLTVAVVDGRVVATAAFYTRADYKGLSRGLTWQALRYYPSRELPRVAWRGNRLKAVMPPPPRRAHYVALLGVPPDVRSRGIGTAVVLHGRAAAERLGRPTYALDVAETNGRARALYERLGFAVTRYQPWPGPPGVPATHRMEMRVGDSPASSELDPALL
jgi:ribosomal protein S18 acetylase RimI-like enzyme